VINLEVIPSHASGQKICLLPVGGLLSRGNARVADQLRHVPLEVSRK
jgi:hypothetical protein